MFTRLLRAGLPGLAIALVPVSKGVAHEIVGNRFFPATLTIDDPGVNDELSLPTVANFNTGDDPSLRQRDISGEFSKRITEAFAVSFGSTFSSFPRQVILQLTAKIFDLLLPFEMGEELVEQKESCLSPGYRAAKAGEMVQLSEHARESCLAALVRAGDDNDAVKTRSRCWTSVKSSARHSNNSRRPILMLIRAHSSAAVTHSWRYNCTDQKEFSMAKFAAGAACFLR